MLDSNATEIPFSKRKLALFLALMIFIAAGGIYLIINAEHITINGVYSPPLTRLLGAAAIGLGTVVGFFLVKKLRGQTPGLAVSAEGFIDNASNAAAGLVAWADVVDLKDVKVSNFSFLLVRLQDPAKYIARPTKKAVRHVLEGNLKTYGSPVLISSNMLDCSYEELKALLTNHLMAYRAGKK